MKIPDWLKNIFNMNLTKMFGGSSKKINNLIIILCIGVLLLIVSNFYKDIDRKQSSNFDNTINQAVESDVTDSGLMNSDYVSGMEAELSSILSKIDNAGKVSVMITVKSSIETIPARDTSTTEKTTEEKDSGGGNRSIKEKSADDKVVFTSGQGGNSDPVITKQINPEIKGVIIVADGAKDPKVKLKLSEAVQTVLDIPAYRVIVFERIK